MKPKRIPKELARAQQKTIAKMGADMTNVLVGTGMSFHKALAISRGWVVEVEALLKAK